MQKKIVDKDWVSEGFNDRSVQEFIVNLCPGDSDSNSDFDEDSDEEDTDALLYSKIVNLCT